MHRSLSLLFAALLAVGSATSVASAQEPGPAYTSQTSTLGFTVPAGWEPQPTPDVAGPWSEVAQAASPADGRVLTVGVHSLPSEMAVDETYKSLMDLDASAIGQLVHSEVLEIPAAHSATGKWVGVYQTYVVPQEGVTLEVARFMLPIGTQQYAISVVGGPDTLSVSSRDVGFVAASLVP